MISGVDLVRTDVSEQHITSIIRVLLLLVTANVLSSTIPVNLMMKTIRSSEKSSLIRITRRNIAEEGITDETMLGVFCAIRAVML
jgi:hypothetical protein